MLRLSVDSGEYWKASEWEENSISACIVTLVLKRKQLTKAESLISI